RLAEPDCRRGSGGAADGGWRDRRAVRSGGGRAAEGGAIALPAGGARADRRFAVCLAADCASTRCLLHRRGGWRRVMLGVEHRCATLGLAATLGIGLLALAASETQAQRKPKPPSAPPVAKEAPHTQMQEVRREQQPGAK